MPLQFYSPELNPCEQAWDVIKDEISNHCYGTIDKLRDTLLPSLKRFWENADTVIRSVAPGCGIKQTLRIHAKLQLNRHFGMSGSEAIARLSLCRVCLPWIPLRYGLAAS